MRYYEWKQYRDKTVKPVLAKCYHHDLHDEAVSLAADIDRAYRLIGYTRTVKKKFPTKCHTKSYSRRELDKKWLEHEIQSKQAYLNDLLVIMRLGS